MSKPRATTGLVLCLLLVSGFAVRQRSLAERSDLSAGALVKVDGQAIVTSRVDDRLVVELATQTDLLRRRIAGTATTLAPPRVVRDVFASEVSPRCPDTVRVDASPSHAPLVTPPALALVGIAEDSRRGWVERTAVIDGANDVLYLAKSGDAIAGGYRVGVVGSNTTEIIEMASGTVFTLALK